MMGILPVKQTEKRARCEQVNAIQSSLAADCDEVVFLDAGKHFLLPDGMHPSASGAKRMAEEIAVATDPFPVDEPP